MLLFAGADVAFHESFRGRSAHNKVTRHLLIGRCFLHMDGNVISRIVRRIAPTFLPAGFLLFFIASPGTGQTRAIDVFDIPAAARSTTWNVTVPAAALGGAAEVVGYHLAPTILTMVGRGDTDIESRYAGAAALGGVVTPLAVRSLLRLQGERERRFGEAMLISSLPGFAGAAAASSSSFRKDFSVGVLIALPIAEAVTSYALMRP